MMLAIEDAQRKEELRVDRTYATAARILIDLIDAKRQRPDCLPAQKGTAAALDRTGT
jgi:hypothetical protein